MMSKKDNVECETCGEIATSIFGNVNLIFKEPRNTSKWEDFSYRAGHLKEQAQQERRDAEAEWHQKYGDAPKPYEHIDDTNIRGVFDGGGVDNELPPNLTSGI